MVKMVIKVRDRRVKISCGPEKKARYERESEEDTVFDTVEYRHEAT